MGYRYIEVQHFEAEDFAAELTTILNRLRREEGAEIVSASLSTMIGAKPDALDIQVMRRIAQDLVWQPEPRPERNPGKASVW